MSIKGKRNTGTCYGCSQAKWGLTVLTVGVLLFGKGWEVEGSMGSLWPADAGVTHSMYSDKKATKVGDLVTIVINLSSVATKDQSTETSKSTSVNDGITNLLFPPGFDGWKWYTYGGQTPSFLWSGSRSHDGSGAINNKETMVTTVTARVVEVNPNGVLKIEAKRTYETAQEESELLMTGFVRQEDLSATNSISSTQVASLQIHQKGRGTISRQQKKGWLTTLYEFLSPF